MSDTSGVSQDQMMQYLMQMIQSDPKLKAKFSTTDALQKLLTDPQFGIMSGTFDPMALQSAPQDNAEWQAQLNSGDPAVAAAAAAIAQGAGIKAASEVLTSAGWDPTMAMSQVDKLSSQFVANENDKRSQATALQASNPYTKAGLPQPTEQYTAGNDPTTGAFSTNLTPDMLSARTLALMNQSKSLGDSSAAKGSKADAAALKAQQKYATESLYLGSGDHSLNLHTAASKAQPSSSKGPKDQSAAREIVDKQSNTSLHLSPAEMAKLAADTQSASTTVKDPNVEQLVRTYVAEKRKHLPSFGHTHISHADLVAAISRGYSPQQAEQIASTMVANGAKSSQMHNAGFDASLQADPGFRSAGHSLAGTQAMVGRAESAAMAHRSEMQVRGRLAAIQAEGRSPLSDAMLKRIQSVLG